MRMRTIADDPPDVVVGGSVGGLGIGGTPTRTPGRAPEGGIDVPVARGGADAIDEKLA